MTAPAGPVAGSGVRWVERHDDPAHASDLLTAAERARVATWCERRQREFATARLCARDALAELGLPGTAPGTGALREPTWPAGVAGSIAHCAGLRAAAVGFHAGIGIDVEPDAPLPEGVGPYVLHPDEQSLLAEAWPVHVDRLVFCVKEAVYKIWSPLTRARLGFHDAVVTPRRDGTFRAAVLVAAPAGAPASLTAITGRWTAHDGLLRVLAVLPRT